MSRHMGCEHGMTICNHVHYNSRRPPYCHDRSTQPQPRHDRELRRRTKANPGWNSVKIQTAGFNPKSSESIIFFGVVDSNIFKLGPQLIGFLLEPFWEILLERRPYINRWWATGHVYWNSLNNLSGMNWASFLLSCAFTNRKFQFRKRYILQGFDGLCLIHHISNPSKTQKNVFIVVNYVHLGLFFRHTLLLEMLVLSNFSRPSSCWWIFLSVNGCELRFWSKVTHSLLGGAKVLRLGWNYDKSGTSHHTKINKKHQAKIPSLLGIPASIRLILILFI